MSWKEPIFSLKSTFSVSLHSYETEYQFKSILISISLYSISLYFYNKINRNTLKIWLILLWCNEHTHGSFSIRTIRHVVSCLIWPRPSHLHRNKPSDWHVKQPTSLISMWCLKVSEIVDITIIKLCVKKTCKYGVSVFCKLSCRTGRNMEACFSHWIPNAQFWICFLQLWKKSQNCEI